MCDKCGCPHVSKDQTGFSKPGLIKCTAILKLFQIRL